MNALNKILVPGIYDMDSETYHADPCPTPSLSAGMINDLLKAPAKCFQNCKRLNPNWEAPQKPDAFSIGSVSHVMFLEPHLFEKKVLVLPYDDYRKGAAKVARDDAFQSGMTPILSRQMDEVLKARNAFNAHPFVSKAFADGVFEQSLFWQHPVYKFWCRARPDFLANSRGYLCDYKATKDADPHNFGKHAHNLGYHRRAAWYLEGCEAVFGQRPEHYWFVNQETQAPFLTSVVELDMNAIEAGQQENERAAAIFAECLGTNDWYGYRHADNTARDMAFRVSLPSWAFAQIDGRN